MSSTVRSNKTRLALGLAALGLVGWLPAQACSLAAWDPNPTGAPVTGGPTDPNPVARYAGLCGLAPVVGADPSFVAESTNHAAEGSSAPLRVRFFVRPGLTAGSPVLLRATDADNGAGTSVVEVAYNSAEQNVSFTVNGVDAGSTAAESAPLNRWSRVQFTYQVGQPFAGSAAHMGEVSELQSPPTVAGGAPSVESVQFGLVTQNGAAGSIFLDEYEASRAATGDSNFTPRIRGDATGDNVCNSDDISGIANDVLFILAGLGSPAQGTPDCTEDGQVNSDDITCMAVRIIDDLLGNATCN